MTHILNIRALRLSAGQKQRDLAEASGISVNTLMRVERGLTPITDELKKRLLSALEVTDLALAEPLRTTECGEGYVTARPTTEKMLPRQRSPRPDRKYVYDLFCGVGGFSAGFEDTGQFEVVAGIDLLGDRLETFAKNHQTANGYGIDIRSIRIDDLANSNPQPFVIVGGPPCQGFSSIRPFRNVDWNDPRNNLAEEFCRIAQALQPEWIVFENVVGLLTHASGKALSAIIGAFEEIGYRTDARLMNGAFYGLPQRRERVIIVGSRRNKRFKWPTPTHYIDARSMAGASNLLIKPPPGMLSASLPPAITVQDAISDLPPLHSGQASTEYRASISTTEYQKFIRNNSNELTLHEATAHSKKMLEIIKHAGPNIHALPPGLVTSGFSSCYSRLAGNEPSVTLTVNFVHPASNRCIHPQQDRALTPREGARLQGFFDTFKFAGTRAQIVKQIGNAVPPILGRKIAEAICESD
ncbi:MAG: DNA (cytosine-5-)-methyltransferase [Rhodospirillaceae bacterium]|nr:DNA (cytosine-5-)-methyltransferase [Rhodospirillaceae bacterium]